MTRDARLTCVLLVVSVALPSALWGQEAARLTGQGVVRGARVRVQSTAGATLEGRVVTLSDSLLVVARSAGAPTTMDSLPLLQLTRLQVRRSPPLLVGGVTGAVVGATAGFAWASSADTDDPVVVPTVTVLGVTGAGLGVGVAALLPRWRDVPLVVAAQ